MGMSKKDLVEYVRMKEHNEAAAIHSLEQQAENLKGWEPVRRGRWIAETDRMGHYSHCSECGARCQGYTPNYKYCPNCGAKMDGGDDP